MSRKRTEENSIWGRTYGWIDRRLKIETMVGYMSHKVVPWHGQSIWYFFGGMTLFFFLVQVITGILLLLYYRPGAESAYESVRFIVSEVSFGWLIRSMHSWSANLMILFAFIHMFSVYFTHAYRRPRELTWISGIALLALAMAFGFSGYLLPWNELSFFATRVGTGMAGSIPVVGDFLLKLMRGGENVTGATIGRFFGMHVAVLPGIFTVFLALHLLFIQRQGMSEPPEWETGPGTVRRYMPFFPNFLLRELLVWLIMLNILAVLAVFFPDGIGPVHWPLGQKADPFAPPPLAIRPEWYFMFAFQTLKFLPAHVLFIEGELFGIAVLSLGGLVWLFIPFWLSRRPHSKIKGPAKILGWIVLAFVVSMTVLGYILE
ncbi:MAG: cytochrome b N-terminal domain-containing protein [Candidatus Zixiibacteriota bacterium]|nr:MAG: cytochrome b N-terminal domain-containing protein [candidate division Zixibacteria bacterium]